MPTLPQDFWLNQQRNLFQILVPIFTKAFVSGTVSGKDLLISALGSNIATISVSDELLSQAAITWANNHTTQVVRQISKTSMAAFLDRYEDWVMSGKPLKELIEQLEPYYGTVRAEMVGVTETTRSFTQGSLYYWRQSGLVRGKKFNSVHDDKVSEICASMDGQVVPLDSQFTDLHGDKYDGSPAHVRCRSFCTPVIANV